MSFKLHSYKSYILLAILFYLFSCTKADNNKENTNIYNEASENDAVIKKNNTISIEVDLGKAGSLKYSDIFSNIEYKILESPSNILVEKVDKVVETRECFFIKSNGKIFIFNKDGKFLSKIDQKGEGPNQYKSITDFIVDTLANHVEILDNHKFAISKFNFSGEFLETWVHGILSFQFQKVDANKYLFYADKELASSYNGRFLLYDQKSKKVTNYYLPIDKRRIKYEGFMDVNNFSTKENEILLSCSGNDTIFSFHSDIAKPKYIFNFAKNGVPDDFYDKKLESVVEFNNERLKNEFAGLYYVSFSENNNILISQIVKGKSVYYLWYDKNQKNYRLINRFEDDLAFHGERVNVSSTFPTYFGAKSALRLLEPESIITPLDSIQKETSEEEWHTFLNRNPKLKILREKIKLTSNPVIQIMTYKQK